MLQNVLKNEADERDNDFYVSEEKKEERFHGVTYSISRKSYRHSDINANIFKIIDTALLGKRCKAYMENLSLMCHPNDENVNYREDYYVPDIMVVCDKTLLKGGRYYGVPKFIVETASRSTAKKDLTEKFLVYEKLGVSEYWVVDAQGIILIYYLEGGKYILQDKIILNADVNDESHNENETIALREFPDITLRLGDIFMDW